MLKPNRFLGIIALLFFMVCIGSCGGGGDGEAPPVTYKIAEYIPLGQGDTRTYRGTENGEIRYDNLTISGTETIGGVTAVKEMEPDGGYALFTVDANGWTWYKSYEVTSWGWEQEVANPPVRFLPAEVTIGQKYTFSSAINYTNSQGKSGTWTGTGEVTITNIEDVTVLAGTFKDCLKGISKSIFTSPAGTSSEEGTYWVCKGIGSVKENETHKDPDGSVHTSSSELVSAKIGGVSYGMNLTYPYIYEVWGGSTSLSGSNGYTPEKYGYTLLGTSSTTQTFSGSYPYYYIVTRKDSCRINLDAIQFSDGSYFTGPWITGGVTNWTNAGGPPDGVYAVVGYCSTCTPPGYYGGYFGVQNTVNSTSIRVIVIQP